jgi:hypothetical protein
MNHTLMLYDPQAFPSSMTLPVTAATEHLLTERRLGIFSPLEISAKQFTAAYELAIGEHVEKNYKGLSYLSWPFAFRYLKEQFPGVYVAFEERSEGWPVFGQEGCWLLRPYLTDGIKRTPALVFPIMDNKHNAVKELDARQVSDNIQRASVKCIATFTGLGLKLYAGEDIPKSDEKAKTGGENPQEETKPAARRSTKAEGAKATAEPAGKQDIAPANEPAQFDGKASLLALCKANPLGFASEHASLKAGRAALEAIGLAKGDDIKDSAMFANVVTGLVTAWAKEAGLTITKEAMATDLDKLRAIVTEGTIEQAIKGVEAFKAGKH